MLERQQHTIMSNATNEQEGNPTSTTQNLDQALDAHHALNEPDDTSTASSAAEEPSNKQTSSMGGFTSFDIAHRFFPVSETSRRIVTRFLRDPTASYYKLLRNMYSTAEPINDWLSPTHLDDFDAENYDLDTESEHMASLHAEKALVEPAFVHYANIPGQKLALDPAVITDQVGAESVLASKLFDPRSRQIIQETRATSEAVSVLNSALNHGIGTSMAGPLCTMMTAFATEFRSLSQVLSMECEPPERIVFHKASFQSTWRSQSSFVIWTSTGWFMTTQSHYIELTDGLLHKPDQAALWLFALTLRRVPFKTVHVYNCPIKAKTITVSGTGQIEVVDHEPPINSQSGADEADLEEDLGVGEGTETDEADEPSTEDVDWAVTLVQRLGSLYGHEDYPIDIPVMMRALGQVLRWSQHLLAGSGSTTAAYKLMAATSYTQFSECESDEGKTCPNLHLNCWNATPGSTITECSAVNPLVLWAYMNKMVALDPQEEPLPLNTTPHGVGMVATVFNIAMRAHSEIAISQAGLDVYFTLANLPSSPDSEMRFHHQQLVQSSIDSHSSVTINCGIRTKVGNPDSLVCQLYSVFIGYYARNKRCLSANTLPLWLVNVLSGEAQMMPPRGEVTVSRVVAPPPWSGDGLDDMVTETTDHDVFWTWGPSFPRSPDLYTYIDGKYGKPSMLCANAYIQPDVYNMDTYSQTATMMLVPKKYLYAHRVSTFALTPHDCTAECVAPLTHMRIPQGSVPVRDRPPMMLGDAASLLNSAFRRVVDGNH